MLNYLSGISVASLMNRVVVHRAAVLRANEWGSGARGGERKREWDEVSVGRRGGEREG